MTSTVLKYLEFIYLWALFFCIFFANITCRCEKQALVGGRIPVIYIFQFFCRQRLHYVSDAAGAAAISANNIKEALDLIYKGIFFF